jgi:hypothetical protein
VDERKGHKCQLKTRILGLKQDRKMEFKPFQNHTQSIAIDELTIENQGERISIYGSLQIHQDQHSLEHAKTLLRILEQTVATLESQNLVIKVQQNNNDDVDVVKNPFLNDTNSE